MRIFRKLLLILSLLLVSLAALGSQPIQAQQLAPATITAFEVTTIDGKPMRDAPLMAGATYRALFTIEVAAGLKEMCVLNTSLVRTSGLDRFWTLKGSYPGIDSGSWQPGQPGLPFNAVAGTAQIELQGTVPEDYVSERLSNGQNLHLGKKISLVQLSLESGAIIADRQLEVIDSSIEEYRNIMSAKKMLLTNMNADPSYTDLARALVTSAEAEAKAGHTDLAIGTLKAIPSSGWVGPRSSTSPLYLWIIVGILAVLVVAAVLLLLKARNELGFLKRETDSHARSLQILAKKASRIGDSTLTAGIEKVQKELEQSIGGS